MRRREFITIFGGMVASWPLSAHAQQPTIPVVGFMSGRSSPDSEHLVSAFRQGLTETGFVEGQTVRIEYRWAQGDYGKLPALAEELIKRGVTVLVGVGGDVSAAVATKATKTIPVVFGMGSDRVKAGFVASFNHPGGNVTGYTLWTSEMESKRLGLLRELLPGVSLIGILLNPQFPPMVQQLEDLESTAKTVNQQLFVGRANNDAELDAALALFVQQGVGALLVTAAPFFDTRHNRIVGFASQNRLPAIYQFREYAVAGGLMSYGPNIEEGYRQRRHICRSHSQGRKARGIAGGAADQIRFRDQPQSG